MYFPPLPSFAQPLSLHPPPGSACTQKSAGGFSARPSWTLSKTEKPEREERKKEREKEKKKTTEKLSLHGATEQTYFLSVLEVG